jgi:hypothetical protein|tara:strand:- start:517 stop:1281 length:765 start_codon:yes stop_codon:yes gene_type:complete
MVKDSLFEVEELTDQDILVTPKEQDPERPAYGSKEWSEFVISKFEKYELIDKNPICAGLRRVAEELLGDIISSGPSEVYPSNDSNGPGRATVVYQVVFNWMNSGEIRTYSEVADVWHGNTDDLFCAHPVATASTRAEGRALRKALKVRCLAAEELAKKDIVSIVRESVKVEGATDGEWDDKDGISAAQVNFIDRKCEQLDISVMEFVNSGENTYSGIEDVSKQTASAMLGRLNQYQNGQSVMPDDIKGYNNNWR